jgi:hypothetical protein
MNRRRSVPYPGFLTLLSVLAKLIVVYLLFWGGLITLVYGLAQALGQVWENGEMRQATAGDRFGGVVKIAAALLIWFTAWALVSLWFRLPRLGRRGPRQ